MPTFLQSIQQLDISSLQEFIQNSIDVNHPCSNDQLPLQIAIQQLFYDKVDADKAMKVIDLLLAAGADPRKITFKKGYSEEETESLLHYLCRQGERQHDFLYRDEKEDPDKDKIYEQKRTLVLALIKKLLTGKYQLDINVRNKNGETLFLVAVNQKNFMLASWLLSAGADATIASSRGYTALHSAASNAADIAFINTLLDQKLDINAVTKRELPDLGDTPLDELFSVNYGNNNKDLKKHELMLAFLKRGARANHHDLLNFFRIAQEHNYAELMDYLFAHGLSKYRDKHGRTALHEAKDSNMIERLLKNGAAIHLQGATFYRLFRQWFSWEYGHKLDDEKAIQQRLHLLREYKADFQVTDGAGNTLLHQAALSGVSLCKFLVENHVPINAQNQSKQTALHNATTYLDVDSAQLLLNHGADPTLPDEKGLVALEYIKYSSVSRKDFSVKECIKLLTRLLEKYPAQKLPSNAADLLLIVVECNHLSLVQDLYARGVSLIEKSKSHWLTPCELMVQHNHMELIKWALTTLKEHPQRLQILTNLLFAAVKYFRPQMVTLFIGEGIDVNKTNDKGESVLGVFVESLADHHGNDSKSEQRAISIGQTLTVLLESKTNINQKNQQNQTALQQLLDQYGMRCWSWAKTLLNKGATIPQGTQYFNCLALMAINNYDGKAVDYIVTQCPSSDKPQVLTYLARFAIYKKADTLLLDRLVKLGLKLDAQLMDHNNVQHYLLDEVLEPNRYYYNFGSTVADVTDAQRESNQQKLVYYLISQGVPLHYPVVNRYESRCVLHIAAERGWVDVLTLLLQPQHGFRPDQRTANYKRETPLQLAVKHGHVAAAQLLYQQGASLLVVTHEGKTLLHIACEKGNISMTEWLLSTKKIDVNTRTVEMFQGAAIHSAAYCHEQRIAVVLVELLINHKAKVDGSLLWTLIDKHAPVNLLAIVIAKLSDQELLESRLLHGAVAANNLLACQLLLKRCPALLNSLSRQGRTALHLATAPGKQAIYDFLVAEKADTTARDYEGYDVNTHALCHGTLAKQANLINMQEFKQLRTGLIEQKEFAGGGDDGLFSLSLYCYNLINLFGTAKVALSYIKKYQDPQSRQPVHDLCQFQLPTHGDWTKKTWADLFLAHGIKVAPYLHWAARIVIILKKSQFSLEEIEKAAAQITYAREAEHPQMAELFVKHKVSEAAFNRVLNVYPKDEKRQNKLPDIYIDGIDIKKDQYYLKKLPPNDLRGFVLGQVTHCCQIVGRQGEACAIHGMTSLYGGFYVVFKRNPDKEIKKAEQVYQQVMKAASLDEFVKQFKEKNRREIYRKRCVEIKSELSRDEKSSTTEQNVLNELRERLKQEWKSLQEGEIIAQSWAWISQQNSLVLDSWERTERPGQVSTHYDALCLPFLEKLAEQAVGKYGFKQLLLGKGGQTPQDLKLDILEQGELPKDYFDYRDSKEQYIVRSREPVNALVTKVIAHSSLFKPTPLTANMGFSLLEMDALLQQAFMTKPHTHLLPSVNLAPHDEQSVSKFGQNSEKPICIQPFFTKEYFWTVLIREGAKTTYLDFAANRIPEQLSSEMNTLQAVYNEDPEQSGIWLLETIRNYAVTGTLTIPVQNIIYKRAELISDTLGLSFSAQPDPIGLVLDYVGLPRLKC